MKRRDSLRMRFLLLPMCLVPLLAAQAVSSDDEGRLRDITRKYFRDLNGQDLAKLVGFTQPVRKVIALEYKVLLATEDRNGNLEEKSVDPKTHTFKLGDRFRITVEPFADYYVYVFTTGASGESQFLLPAGDEDPPKAKRNQPVTLPDDGYLEFTPPAGEEMLTVVASEEAIEDMDVFEQVLTKEPGEDETEEEKQLRKSLKATRKKVLKSVEESRKEILDKTVIWRGIVTDKACDRLAKDIRTRGVAEGTFEEPTRDGISAVYASIRLGGKPKLLVHIPLKSDGSQSAEP